jgi:hypothetical protein
MSQQTLRAKARHTQSARLLACGTVAGPLFLTVGLIQALTRDGFDLSRHPLSLLSLGDLGWIQIANFIVTGALYVACALGARFVARLGRRQRATSDCVGDSVRIRNGRGDECGARTSRASANSARARYQIGELT